MFFIAAKILGALLRPETLLLLLIAGGVLALWSGRRRLGRALSGAGLFAFAALAALPLGDLAIRPLETAYPAHPAAQDVRGIVLLGGGAEPIRSAFWGVPQTNAAGDRYLAALALAHRFPAAKLLFTGGDGRLIPTGPSEARTARAILLSAGLSPDRLLLERKSRNTAQNARFSRDLIDKQGLEGGTWLLVTSAAHMPRAMAAFCAAGWTGLTAWPTDYRSGPFWAEAGWDLPDHLATLDFAVHEWLGLLAYRLTGRAGHCKS